MTESNLKARRKLRKRPDITNGWGWFLFGFLAALFVGGAIRGLLSPQKIKLLIDNAVQAGRPPFALKFDSAELSLRDGVLPRLGILAKGLRLQAIDRCVTGSELQIRELFVPISLTEALMGRLFVRRIRVVDTQLHLKPPQCSAGNGAVVTQAQSLQDIPADTLAFFEKFFRTRFAQELINTREQLEGLEMEDFRIFKSGESEPFVTLSYVRADSGSGSQPAHAVARLEFAKNFVGTSVAPYVWLDFVGELNRIQLNVRTLFREGLIEGQATLSLPDTTVQWHADIKHFPIKPFYDRFLASMFPHFDLNLEGAWGFCHLQSSATLARILSDPTHVSQCYVEGSLGQMKLAPTKLALKTPWQIEPTAIEIHDLALARLFAAGERLSFGVFEVEPEGLFSGILTLGIGETRVVGRVQNVELGFWRGLVRARQPIATAAVDWTHGQTGDVLKISDIQSQGSAWKGQVSLTRDHEQDNHQFQISLSEVKLDRSLAHLFLPAELKPFEVKLRGELKQDHLVSLTGDFQFPKVTGSFFSLENLSGSVSADAKQFSGRGDARNLQVFNQSVLNSLKPLLEESSKSSPANLSFERIRGDWEYRGQTVIWKGLRLLAKGSAARWLTDGDFDHDQILSATAFRLDAQGNWTKWRLAGTYPLALDIQKDPLVKAPDRQTRQMLQGFETEHH